MNLPLNTIRSLAVAGILGALACASSAATTTALSIVSDGSWKSTATLQPGWFTPGFDDSGWSQARAPYPSPQPVSNLIAGTSAQRIWHDPLALSDGTNGAIETWYRRGFSLDLSSGAFVQFAHAIVFVDDDFEFYVNGNLVYTDVSGGFADVPHFIDFSSHLVNGNNVLAIHAVDGGLFGPYDRLYESLLVDAVVRTAGVVPEPSTVALLLAGFAGVAVAVKRRRADQA